MFDIVSGAFNGEKVMFGIVSGAFNGEKVLFGIVSGAFNGEKVMFDLPSGIKAEEVAWISVWCRAYRSIICICGQGQRVNMYLFYLK